MSGQQHSHKLQSGKQLLDLVILILVICLTLSSCANRFSSVIPGSGRTDWEIQLSDQYYIIRANSSSKKICKTTDTPGLYDNVLSYFYVTRYSLFDQFIIFEGIPTEELFASEEEKAGNNRQYYLLDIQNGSLYGPYNTEDDLLKADIANDIDTAPAWVIVPQ